MTIHEKINNLRHHVGFRRYAFNTTWLMGEKILRMFVGLFVGIWIARYLGPEQFGLLSYAQSFVFLFTAIATLGLDGIVVRELVKNDSQEDVLLGSAFGLKLLGAILILPILLLAVGFTNNDFYTNLMVFFIASATIFQSFNVIDFYYQSRVQSKYVAIANSVMLGFSSLVKITLILNEAPLIAFAVMTLFDSIILSLGLIYFYKSKSQRKVTNWQFEWGTAKQLLKDSWPLILSGLVISSYMKIDQVMIKEMLDAEAVGLYAAAVRLSEAWYFIPIAIVNSVFPAIIRAKVVDPELYMNRMQRLFTIMVWMGISAAVLITLIGDLFIVSLYGTSYIDSSHVLKIHIWTAIFVFLGVTSSKWLLAENLTLVSFKRTFYGLIINIIMNLILIPRLGIIGAAYSILMSQIFSAFIYDLFDKKTRRIFFMKSKAFIGKV